LQREHHARLAATDATTRIVATDAIGRGARPDRTRSRIATEATVRDPVTIDPTDARIVLTRAIEPAGRIGRTAPTVAGLTFDRIVARAGLLLDDR
jgi:hypothetical protein